MWNKEKAIEHLMLHAETHSQKKCAKYTREAIEAGGLILIRPNSNSAKDYKNSLIATGFLPLGVDSGKYLPGDVVIINSFTDGAEEHPHGHIAMFDGNNWVSDFSQQELYPGPAYRKCRPKYMIYRYGIQWDSAESPLSSNIA